MVFMALCQCCVSWALFVPQLVGDEVLLMGWISVKIGIEQSRDLCRQLPQLMGHEALVMRLVEEKYQDILGRNQGRGVDGQSTTHLQVRVCGSSCPSW